MNKFIFFLIFLILYTSCSHFHSVDVTNKNFENNKKIILKQICFKRGFDIDTSQPLNEKDLIFGEFIKSFLSQNPNISHSCESENSLNIVINENRIFDESEWYSNLYPLIRTSKFTFEILIFDNKFKIHESEIYGRKTTSMFILPFLSTNQNQILIDHLNQILNTK